MNDELISQLVKLNNTGSNGFEGLIGNLLERLTGRKFYLARPGNQAGRDLSSDHREMLIIGVECKRYRKTTELSERELQGELAQAVRSFQGLDVWVLATSRDISSQLFEALQQQAETSGVTVVPIASGTGGIGTLDALCASSIDIVIQSILGQATDANVATVRQELTAMAGNAEFEGLLQQLKDSLSPAHVGYPSWSAAQKRWLGRCLSSEQESRAHMGQLLNVGDPQAGLIERKDAWAALDSWLTQWGGDPRSFVITGEEGDGKTWTAASWVYARMMESDAFPPVLFLPSEAVTSTDPHTLISQAISLSMGHNPEGLWSRRLEQWTQRPDTDGPLILLVLDGINERHDSSWWRRLLECLVTDPWQTRIAVMVTCRSGYWEKYFAPLRNVLHANFQLASFNDLELESALSKLGVEKARFGSDLLPLLRKPRYLALVVQHWHRIEESGDYTPARLIYEDWRDRYERKRNTTLSDSDFRDLIREMARKRLSGQTELSRHDVDDLLSLRRDADDVLRELETSGILRNLGGRYQVDQTLLVHGLGLLLADQALAAAEDPTVDVGEVIARWLEPHAEIDLKARICEVAALHTLQASNSPLKVQVALLRFWIGSKNPSQETEEHFVAYYPMSSQAYFSLAELIWSEEFNNLWAQELLMGSLLHWRNVGHLEPQFVRVFERWLGFIHPSPYPFIDRPEPEKLAETRRVIAERFGHELVPGLPWFSTCSG